MGKVVAVLGATNHVNRYANRAIKLLQEKGHTVIPVNPLYSEIEGLHSLKSLSESNTQIDTITIYVNQDKSTSYTEEIISANPERVIINPGAENEILEKHLKDAGITVVRDCTLGMLRRDQF